MNFEIVSLGADHVTIWFSDLEDAKNAGVACPEGWEEADLLPAGSGWLLFVERI